MSRLTTYTRSRTPNMPGCQELDYWRRIHLPYFQLVQQHVFESFSQVELDENQELSVGMLLASEMTVLQNWIPQSSSEVAVFDEAYREAMGRRPVFWIYDLSDPMLLEDEFVRDILPCMHLVTVPNEHLRQEVRYFLRNSQHGILTLPSTISQTWLLRSLPQKTRALPYNTFRIGMLGDHDWERFVPTFFAELAKIHTQVAHFHIVTDQAICLRMAQEWQIPVQHVALSASSYADVLAGIDVGLCPREGKDGRHTAWACEYGLALCPILACQHSSYADPDIAVASLLPYQDPATFVAAITSWLTDDQGLESYYSAARMGYAMAMRKRVSVLALTYRLRLRDCLPAFCFLA